MPEQTIKRWPGQYFNPCQHSDCVSNVECCSRNINMTGCPIEHRRSWTAKKRVSGPCLTKQISARIGAIMSAYQVISICSTGLVQRPEAHWVKRQHDLLIGVGRDNSKIQRRTGGGADVITDDTNVTAGVSQLQIGYRERRRGRNANRCWAAVRKPVVGKWRITNTNHAGMQYSANQQRQ